MADEFSGERFLNSPKQTIWGSCKIFKAAESDLKDGVGWARGKCCHLVTGSDVIP